MSALPIAYLTADPGIPPDSNKGASVHFRELSAAFARIGIPLDVFFGRAGDVSSFLPQRATTVPTPRSEGVAGEVMQLSHSATMLEAMKEAGPHNAVYERLSLFGLAGMAYAQACGIPHIVEVNAPLWREASLFRGLSLQESSRAVCLDVMRQADKVLAVSCALAEELVESGVPRERIQVFGNGADLRRFRESPVAKKPAKLEGRPTLLFLGSLKPWHGIEFLLEAFSELRKAMPCGLWVVGEGPGREAVLEAAKVFPDDIVADGSVSHELVPSILKAADLVVAPYTLDAPAYFSPLKLVEAFAAGRPILASRVRCVMEALEGQDVPGLFAPGDVKDFVRAAKKSLAAGPSVSSRFVDSLDWECKARKIAGWCGVEAVSEELVLEEVANG